MDALIMCAGLGTRLRPLTDTCPKPLLPINGKGSLLRTLEALPESVTRIIITVNYLAEQIIQAVGPEFRGRSVVYVMQNPLDGTGGSLRQAKSQITDLSERFLVINGDDLYVAADLERLAAIPCGLLALQTVAPRDIDSCDISDGLLRGFTITKKGETGFINVGAYCLNHRWFDTDPVLVPGKTTEWSLPHAMLQLLAQGVPVQALQASFWMPVGTPDELKAAEMVVGV